MTRRPSRARCTWSANRARTRSGRGRRRATTSRRSARGSGTATTTRGGARRRSSIPSGRSGSARRGSSPRSRRGDAEGDLYISSDPTPAGKQAECSHRDQGQRPVQVVLALRARLVERQRHVSLRALRARARGRPAARLAIALVDKGSSPAGRPVVTARKDGCADVVLNVEQPDGKRVVAAWQVFVGWSKPSLKVDHLRLHFDRLLVRRGDGSRAARPTSRPARRRARRRCSGRSRAAPASGSSHWSVDGIWGRWPGTLAARDGSVFKGRQSVDFFVAAGAAVVARHPGPRVRLRGAARLGRPGSPDGAVPADDRDRQLEGRRLPGRDRGHLPRRRARAPRHERLHGRLVLPAVEHARVLSADVHGYACALTGERNRHGQEPALPTRLAR